VNGPKTCKQVAIKVTTIQQKNKSEQFKNIKGTIPSSPPRILGLFSDFSCFWDYIGPKRIASSF
jgi:hypothetical protein